jgi:hypothetical protein
MANAFPDPGTNFPNTGSSVNGHSDEPSAISSTLSTQIIIKVGDTAVGALQSLSVTQTRPLERIKEIGTDGVIEIVPNGATEFELSAERIVFDQLRLPEAFSRGFRFINSQRLPFDILVVDFSNTGSNAGLQLNNADLTAGVEGQVSMVYRNCWFTNYTTPYNASGYIITETATIWAETAYVSSPSSGLATPLRTVTTQTDQAGVEASVNRGGRRGAMDASGLVNAVFAEE